MDLTDSVQLLERYSAIILPVLVIAEQVGIPLPAVPALLAVGALAAKGRVNLLLVTGAIVAVALPVDLVWHELGRRRGARLLSRLCPGTHGEPRGGGDPRRLCPPQGSASTAVSPASPDRADLSGGPQAQARGRGGRRDPRPPHRAGRGRHSICHSRQPLDRGGG